MAKYYKQEKGLMLPPPGFSKFNVTWNLDNVLEGFKKFYEENKRFPKHTDFANCNYLPTTKTLERNFGGIKKIRKLLGIEIADLRTGKTRQDTMKTIWKRGLAAEDKLYKLLIGRFHEPFVHEQSKAMVGEQYLRVDFLIYHANGKFAIDIFYPESHYQNLSSNISAKYRIYRNFPYTIYLCIANPEISIEQIERNIDLSSLASKRFGGKLRNNNAVLISINALMSKLGQYTPLKDPYI